jgi:hypothetical protein
MSGLARAISFFLHPIITLSPIPFVLVAKFSHDYSYALKWTLFSYMFVLIVALFVVIGVELGVFSNFNVSKREQRPLLFAFSAFAIFCYSISLIILRGPRILLLFVFAIIFGLVVFLIANKWIKASIHVAMVTSVSLLLGLIYGGYFFLFLALVPILSWSRISMKQHTLRETIVGSILGIVITLTIYQVSKQFLLGMFYS